MNPMHFLDRSGRALYRQLSPHIDPPHLPLLATYCQAWSDYLQATKDIDENGAYRTLPNGCEMLSPAVKRQQIAQGIMSKTAKQLGIANKGQTEQSWFEDLERR